MRRVSALGTRRSALGSLLGRGGWGLVLLGVWGVGSVGGAGGGWGGGGRVGWGGGGVGSVGGAQQPVAKQPDPATRAFDLERRGQHAQAAEIYRNMLNSRPADMGALLGLERCLAPTNKL